MRPARQVQLQTVGTRIEGTMGKPSSVVEPRQQRDLSIRAAADLLGTSGWRRPVRPKHAARLLDERTRRGGLDRRPTASKQRC